MIWVALAIFVIVWIIDLWKAAASKKTTWRARRCQHGVLGACPRCQHEAEERARAAELARAEANAQLDEAFFAIDDAMRKKITDQLEQHRVEANLPDWTSSEQMKQAVVKIYRQSLTNEGKPMEIKGASIRR